MVKALFTFQNRRPHFLSRSKLHFFKKKIHSKYGICTEQIVLGNGASELILQIPFVVQADYALIAVPCYSGYKEAISLLKIPCIEVTLKEEKQFRLDINELRDILKSKPDQKALVF